MRELFSNFLKMWCLFDLSWEIANPAALDALED